jgi:SAM-dependent methyltransferase
MHEPDRRGIRPEDAIADNRRMWDTLVPINRDSALYDRAGFVRGRCSLDPVVVQEVGDVQGKSLLHLQCHFGMDTLSWARRGALATGADFSPAAITEAHALAQECGLSARFIESDLYTLDTMLTERFDVVTTSEGVLCWLPDLEGWARRIRGWLKPGGRFHLFEFHPFSCVFDDRTPSDNPALHYPYFPHRDPLVFDDEGCYAEPDHPLRTVSHEWSHPLSEVVSALCAAGLSIDFLHEFPFSTYAALPMLVQRDGRWVWPGRESTVPLTYSIRATAPE